MPFLPLITPLTNPPAFINLDSVHRAILETKWDTRVRDIAALYGSQGQKPVMKLYDRNNRLLGVCDAIDWEDIALPQVPAGLNDHVIELTALDGEGDDWHGMERPISVSKMRHNVVAWLLTDRHTSVPKVLHKSRVRNYLIPHGSKYLTSWGEPFTPVDLDTAVADFLECEQQHWDDAHGM